MKRLITILMFLSLAVVGFGQVLAPKGIKVGTGVGAQIAYNLTSNADYVIDKVGSTYYARPGIGTGLTAYSSATFKTMMDNVQAALTSGGTVFIKAGLYDNLDIGAITPIYSNITVQGAGQDLTILKLKASADVGASATISLIRSDVNNFTVKDLQLDGNGTNQTLIDNNASTTAKLSGIMTSTSASYNKFENVYVHDFPLYGIYIAGASSYCEINNSKLKDNYWNNITLLETSSYNKVSNCECIGAADVGISAYGINQRIENCLVKDVIGTKGSNGGSWGIGIEEDTPHATNTHINNCTVTGVAMKCGISIAPNSTYCSITNCNIFNIYDAIGVGISIGSAATNNIISNNKIWHIKANGIYMDASSSNMITNNNVFDGGNNAMFIDAGSDNNKVLNNYLQSLTNTGLFINAAGTVMIGNTIDGNYDSFNDLGTGTVKRNNYVISSGVWNWNYETGTLNKTATATVAGATTGILTQGSQNVTVTSANAAYIIALPAASAAVVGTVIIGSVGANGFHLRTQSAQEASVYLNGVTGAGKSITFAASTSFRATCIDATHWIIQSFTAAGVASAPTSA